MVAVLAVLFVLGAAGPGWAQAADEAELDRLAADADLAIIDCPPELTDPARVAALLSDLVLVPCTPSPLDIWAAEAAVELAHDAVPLKWPDYRVVANAHAALNQLRLEG
jgi:cellulose biosynthesis protein BcsQ